MKQFYETYSGTPIVSPLVRQIQNTESQSNTIVSSLMRQLSDIRETILVQIGWTHHMIIFTRTKTPEEKQFYIRTCIRERYSTRELDRQISSGLFERVMLGKHQFPPTIQHPLLRRVLPERQQSIKFWQAGLHHTLLKNFWVMRTSIPKIIILTRLQNCKKSKWPFN
jgi:predicted nuclease of restriction endonuclease-like (RecB) superfamily